MLTNAAARRGGLAPPPKLRRPFDAASPLPCQRCSSLSSSPVRSKSGRAESKGKRNQKSPTSRAAAVPLGSSDNDRGLDLATSKEKKNKAPPLLLGDGLPTQEAAYDALARIAVGLLEEAEEKNKKKRVVVGLAGGPGSGKSTAAAAVVERVNGLWREKRQLRQRQRHEGEGEDEDSDSDVAVVLPMDGFHLTRAQLAASTDPPPEEMFARRGAHWTFDGAAFVRTVRDVVEAGAAKEEEDGGEKGRTVLAPSFDHGVGDPCPGAVAIKPRHRLVLVEGNYLLLPLEPWASLPPLFDQSWFLDVRVGEAMERVRARQLAVGVSAEVSKARVEGNDRPNGELVASTRARADVVVRGDLPLGE